jgi:hypothetical protein
MYNENRVEALDGRSLTEILNDPKIINNLQIRLMRASEMPGLDWIEKYSPRLREILNESEFTDIGDLIRDIDHIESSDPIELERLYIELVDKVESRLAEVE